MAFWQSLQTGYGRTFLNTVLTAFGTRPAGALIVAGKLRLSQDAAYQPTPASAVSDLSAGEADFSGYTAGGYTVTPGSPVNLTPGGQALVLSQVMVSTTATPFVPNSIYGWWVDDGTNVIAYEAFPTGSQIGIGAPGDFLDLQAILSLRLSQTA